MNIEIVLAFAMLFAAVIALICAVYLALGSRKILKIEQDAQDYIDDKEV